MQYYHFFTKPANCTSYGGSGVATITFDPSSASTNTSKPGIDPAAIAVCTLLPFYALHQQLMSFNIERE